MLYISILRNIFFSKTSIYYILNEVEKKGVWSDDAKYPGMEIPTNQPIDWSIDRASMCVSERASDRQTGRPTDQPTDREGERNLYTGRHALSHTQYLHNNKYKCPLYIIHIS